MNDVDFPVADVLEGIEAALAAGLAPVKVNMVVKRGTNDDGILAMAERFRGTGVILRFIEYMDVGATNGWRLDEVVPSAEIVTAIDERWPLEPVDPGYLGEVAARYRYRDGERRDRPDLVGHAAVLPRLHARAPVGRGQALHLPLRRPRPRPARARAQRVSDAELDEKLRALWRVRDDRYSELRTQGTPRRPAQGRDVAHRRLTPGERRRGRGRRAAPCGRTRGASPRRRAPRAHPDAARAARTPATCARSARRVASASRAGRGGHQGHVLKVRQVDAISEIVIRDVSDSI